jgi:hypothetical protein
MGKSVAKCVIEIKFDRVDRTYRPGERITGTVEILPGAQCVCRKITLEPRWEARGVGPQDSACGEGAVLPGGIWVNNEIISLKFDLPAPAGPISYQGESFEVAWLLDVKADISLATDASAVEGFTLVHGQHDAAAPSFQITDAYNPFSALAPELQATTSGRDKPPAFYSALGLIPRYLALPIVGAILGYFVGMRQEYFEEGYEGAIVWGLIILFGSLVLAGRFRRKMLDKRREAENRQLVRDTAAASAHPRLPGKYWLNRPPDDSQHGWARSIFSLSLGAFGLLLIAVGTIHFLFNGWTPESTGFLGAVLLGLLTVGVEFRLCMAAWRFVKTQLALGPVEVLFSPDHFGCGDDLYVNVEFRPSKPVRISRATATLEAFEIAESFFKHYRPRDAEEIMERLTSMHRQAKKHRFARVRPVRSHAVTLAENRSLLPQEGSGLSGKISLPADSPSTLLALEHKVLWFLAIRLDLADGIRWSKDIPIFVRP